MNSFLRVFSATIYLFTTLLAVADAAAVPVTNSGKESSSADPQYTTIAPNNLQAFNRAVSKKHVKLADNSCFVESETYELTEKLSFGFFVEQKLDGSYGIKWYYEKKKFFSFDLLKVKFRHNNDFFNNIFHTTIFDGFFYSWYTESWDSILAQTFEISVTVEEKEVIYSTYCGDRENCTPLQIPSSAPCSEKSSTLVTRSSIPKTSSAFRVSSITHDSLTSTTTSQIENPETTSSSENGNSLPIQYSKSEESNSESDTSTTQESQGLTDISSKETSQSQDTQSFSSESTSSSSPVTTKSTEDSKPTGVLLTFSVSTTSFSSKTSDSSISSITSTKEPNSQQSYYPIEFDCPTQVPTMFPITDNTILGYYIEALGNSKYRIDWFFTFPEDFKISDFKAYFKQGDNRKFNIFAEKWENGFFYSYTASSWNELVSYDWDFELEGFFNSLKDESDTYFTTIFFSSNCGTQEACNPISIPETSSEVFCTAPVEQTSTTNANYPSLTTVTTTISGMVTSYTTYCPDTVTSDSSSSKITVVTETISGTLTSYTTYCPDTVTSDSSSSKITVVTETISGTLTSYTTYCPDTVTSGSSSSKITVVTDTVSGTLTSYTTYCPDTVTSDSSYSNETVITHTAPGTLTSYTTHCSDETESDTSVPASTSSKPIPTIANSTASSVFESTTSDATPESNSSSGEGYTLNPSVTTCETNEPSAFGEMPSQSFLAYTSAPTASIVTHNTVISSYFSQESSTANSASSSASSEMPLSVINGASKSVISYSILTTFISCFILF